MSPQPSKAETLILPYPPALNNLYATVNGRRVLSERGRAYKHECGWKAKAQGARPQKGNLSVRMDIYRPRKAGDIDGAFKACFDALTGICWEDDRQIVSIHAERFDDKTNPRVELTVSQCRRESIK